MENLTKHIKEMLVSSGADFVAVGDLTGLPPDGRGDLPVGISVALKLPAEVVIGISELPTAEYYEWYNRLNERLDELVTLGAEELKRLGYEAVAQTRERAGNGAVSNNTDLPHKTVATRAGMGWIGKSALLVTDAVGSRIRLSSILTNAPLETAEPVNESKCGDCMICAKACPAGAISGKIWEPSLYRDEFFDPVKCRETALIRSKRGFGKSVTICGKCIAACPYTKRACHASDR